MLVGHAEREVFPKVNLVFELSPTPARVLHYGPVDQVGLVVRHLLPPPPLLVAIQSHLEMRLGAQTLCGMA